MIGTAFRNLTGRSLWLIGMLGVLACITSAARADPVNADAVRAMARGWLNIGTRPLGARLGDKIDRLVSYPDTSGQVAWYVVYLRPSGFVIVPADDWLEPILAFAPRGVFDPSPTHPLGALVAADMHGRMASIRHVRQMIGVAPLPGGYRANQEQWRQLQDFSIAVQGVKPLIPSVSDARVPPLVQSVWDQTTESGDYCYNYFTPNHYPCGCGPTALAQLMRYHQYPVAGVGARSFEVVVENDPAPYQTLTLLGGDGVGGPYDWSLMPLDPDGSTPDTQRQAIGALCHDAGVAVQSRYGPMGTSSDFFTCKEILLSVFYFSSAIAGFNDADSINILALYTMVNPNLDAGFPAILGIEGDVGGHAVVCDGYGYDHGTLYHHVNMGWGAYYAVANAWYALPLIDAVAATFTAVDACMYNVFSSGSGEIVSGRITDSDGQPLAGANVTATLAGSGALTVVSDSRGIYALARLPSSSTYTLTVEKRGYTFSGQTVSTGRSADYENDCGNQWGIDFTGVGGGGPTPDVSNQTAMADYDGDKKADPAIYETSTGRWYIWLSSQNYGRSGPHTFSQAGYTTPVPADYDGDGKADPAVCKVATGAWYVWLSSAGYAGVGAQFFYQSDYSIPVPGDYDGDGQADPAVFNSSTGEWYFWLSSAEYTGLGPRSFTQPDYTLPAPSDYDGDGKADPAVCKVATGAWYVWLSSAGYTGAGPYTFGQSGYTSPTAADCDGDSRADPGVFNPSAGSWFVWLSAGGYAGVGPVDF